MSLGQSSFALRRLSGVELFVALIIFFVSFPFIEPLKAGSMIKSVLLTLVLVSAVLAISDERRTLIVASVLAVPALLARWINHYRPDLMPSEVFLIIAILFMIFVIGNLLRFVLKAKVIDISVLSSAISAFLLIGVLWTFAYWLVAELNPDAFSFNIAKQTDTTMDGFDGLYFSLITLCTVGYGDITPVSRVARMLAAMEAITGLLFVAVLIARLVSIHSAASIHDSE